MLEKKSILISFRQKKLVHSLPHLLEKEIQSWKWMETHILRSCLVFHNNSVVSKMQHWIKYFFWKGLYTLEIPGKSTDQEDFKSVQEPTTLVLRTALARAPTQASDFTRTTLDSWRKHPESKFEQKLGSQEPEHQFKSSHRAKFE